MSASWGGLAYSPPHRRFDEDWRFQSLPEATTPLLAVGARRSYGDACVNEGATILETRRLDRFVRFDEETGLLVCEAGVSLGEILRAVVPRGWYLPVVPGTQHVTLGGAVASDVHGKNHVSAGSFGCHVRSLRLLRSDRGVVDCDADVEPGLFAATIGGLGLTGLIIRIGVQLRRVPGACMDVRDLAFASLDEYLERVKAHSAREYSVAWLDGSRLHPRCRGVLSIADHAAGAAAARRRAIPVPVTPPFSLINRASAWGFCRAYALRHARLTRLRKLDHAAYFFPLDGIDGWNRLYGPKGFLQYQCVIPAPAAREGILALLRAVNRSGLISPVIVLKDFGPRASPGLLSFPREGLTLAMDFPGAISQTRMLFDALDAIVRDYGGALYPAKDARMETGLFRASFPRLDEFVTHLDPCFSSSLWRRLS